MIGRDCGPDTEFKEEGANIRIDKDFSDTENLRIWYNHRNGTKVFQSVSMCFE